MLSLLFCVVITQFAQVLIAQSVAQRPRLPLRGATAQQFLARRGWRPGTALDRRLQSASSAAVIPLAQTAASSLTWSPLGPGAILTSQYGLVSGRISAIALDPADSTGNHLYIGTTGGGVWMAQNAATSPVSQIVFTPLTDNLSALGGAWDASISVGAIAVQPGGTGVVLAGTGDPNDALDSYYGAGILRSTDGGSTWSLIAHTSDYESSLSMQDFSFGGEGFAGFAWSTVNPQVVVAAVSQAYEGALVNATLSTYSTQGLFYSNDSGATWHLATITDGSGADVQGPLDLFPAPDGNAATSVVWNPMRQVFIAAVRYHGYYQSADGVTWTRMSAQPGTGLTAAKCPTNSGSTGSTACPIFRGALAVNSVTGDTFAWTVDQNSQDQGLWQDQCSLSANVCANSSIAFQQQWSTAALQTSTTQGKATIADGVYNLVLAAIPVPQQQATMVLAGANDLWRSTCPVSQGCSWRNTTNAATCMKAQVGPFQHAVAWNASNAYEVFVGNDSGLWRSMDGTGVNSTDAACSASDATHFANLNGQFLNADGSVGSLTEVESLPPAIATPYTLLAGVGVNGATGVKASAVTSPWPQVLGGYGGPVAIDPNDSTSWYVNDQAGVAIYHCSQSAACTPSDFGTSPAIDDSDVGGDGEAMSLPAPFIVDPLDSTRLLVGTCRLWRGPASGGWSASNAISPILDIDSTSGACQGNALIRSVAAVAESSSSEVLYVGMYGSVNGGANLAGHVLSATLNTSSSSMPVWTDLTSNAVNNDGKTLNYYGFDISNIVVDPNNHKTIYVTVEGEASTTASVQTVYRSTDAGVTWSSVTANLPNAPVSAIAIDPGNANTVYVATDQGVFYTTEISACTAAQANCWSAFGSGLPQAPVVALSATPQSASSPVLVAATYGRGIWQTALWTAGTSLSAASTSPASLTFPSQAYGVTSAAQSITLYNTGSMPLLPSSISMSGDAQDFSASGCTGQSIAVGSSCTIQVTFTPYAAGSRTAVMTIFANVYGGQLTVDLNGTGLAAGSISLTPSSLAFGTVESGTTSATQPAQLVNLGTSTISISSVVVTSPFVLSSKSCSSTLAVNSSCQVTVAFAPTAAGEVTGLLTFSDSAGTQTVQLTGTGAAASTDTLTPTSLSFPATASGQVSVAQSVTITNSGDLPLHVTSIAASANFQQSSNCLSGVAAHTNCAISVSFAPTQVGSLTGTLTITDDLKVESVALSGTGLQPGVLGVSPASLTFSTQQTGVTSAPQTVTVTNTGGATLANIGFQITGAAASSYALGATTCGATLAGGAPCTVQITFTPSANGPIAATLAVSTSTAGVAAAQVQLNGSGQLTGGLTATPSPLTFTTAVGVGQPSSAQTVTIANTSSYAISSITPTAAAPFSVSANTCATGLAVGATCTASIVFQPTATGAASGTLTIASSSLSTPTTVPLSGTGFDFAVQTSGSSSITVSNGQQADFKLVITPNGAQGTFSFQCGTLPSNALCIFSPTTETLTTGVQGNVMVQIYTGNSSTTARSDPAIPGRRWPLVCAFLLLPFAFRRGRRMFLLMALAACLATGITSCAGAIGGSGSSSGSSSSTGTPAGTYSVPVTVTSAGISHSVTLSLTVD